MTRHLDKLRPGQIRAVLAERSLIWLPLGTIEWHCEHLPVGLDAATAHALCLAASETAGGLVYPPLYYGTGGDHGAYPWTIMMPDASEIERLLTFTLKRLSDLNVERCVIFSGHFADEQLAMIDRIAETWNALGRAPRVTATSVNRCSEAGLPPDHAGVFESTLMAAIAQETIDLSQLPEGDDTPDRHAPDHPLWGIIGADPRGADLSKAPALFDRLAGWLASQSH